ncbi:MAG: XRE family transcriptional regulator [Candidatus Deferrimicrobium sp.]
MKKQLTRPYRELREKMSPEARARAAAKTKEMLAEMPLNELRHARSLSQERLAEILRVNQASISKLERRTDMYISTLRSFIQAMGGRLEINAIFPDGPVMINQFQSLESEAVTAVAQVSGEQRQGSVAQKGRIVHWADVVTLKEGAYQVIESVSSFENDDLFHYQETPEESEIKDESSSAA